MKAHERHDHDTGAPLIALVEARRRALEGIGPLAPAERPLEAAHGCVLAEDVLARRDLPPFASSAMDGFAIRAADVAAATAERPAPLRLVARVEMGRATGVRLGPGHAVAVPTGGAIPDGADAVVPIEHCAIDDDRVAVLTAVPRGRHVRPAGEDAAAGELIVPAGRLLRAPDLGLLAAAGLASVRVHSRPRVAILSTGDELVGPGDDLRPGQIFDANGFTLRGAVLDAGAIPVPLGRVPDRPDALAGALTEAASRADVLVSSGGVSVGERDPVKAAFAGRGDVSFLEVAMQPGKPQAFGRVGGVPYFGLPGNPVSVFVSFEVFVRPALMRMMGRPERRPEVPAMLETEIAGPREKVAFARVRVRLRGGRWVAASTGGRQSNLLGTVSRGNGLAVIPAGTDRMAPGETVAVMLFRDPDEP